MLSTTITSFDVVPPTAAPKRSAAPLRAHAKFDSAATTPENRAHWSRADSLSANAAADPMTRGKMRDRSRYEDANSPNFQALIDTRAVSVVGIGPRFQVRIPGVSSDDCRKIERRFAAWWKLRKMRDKLALFDTSDTREGELFGVRFDNTNTPPNEVSLDLKLVEADQCTTPDIDPNDPLAFDGGRVDSNGDVTEYHFLRYHPGGTGIRGGSLEYDRIPARSVIHYYSPRRANQSRGLPALQASLPGCSTLRRWDIATLASAETQARLSVAIKRPAELPGYEDDGDDEPNKSDLEVFQEGNSNFMILPAGDEAQNLTPSHPGPQYDTFKSSQLTQSGRPIGAPRNISTGSSAEYNFSSARLDVGLWNGFTTVRRLRQQEIILDPVVYDWQREGRLIPGYFPPNLPAFDEWVITWRWPAYTSLDPEKDGKAIALEQAGGYATLDKICGERGEDWEEILEQQVLEEVTREKLRKKYGIKPTPTPPASTPADDEDEVDTELAADDETITDDEEAANV